MMMMTMTQLTISSRVKREENYYMSHGLGVGQLISLIFGFGSSLMKAVVFTSPHSPNPCHIQKLYIPTILLVMLFQALEKSGNFFASEVFSVPFGTSRSTHQLVKFLFRSLVRHNKCTFKRNEALLKAGAKMIFTTSNSTLNPMRKSFSLKFLNMRNIYDVVYMTRSYSQVAEMMLQLACIIRNIQSFFTTKEKSSKSED
ncbi:CLUMA_CG001010, isoform A [Clunio marinus]|uniref:CLUMA_CG001010, isoform A n=1 Tax=Clunio marinus TaxID=568069 RepID=A0A1J1HL75_9DIPT|nr:CLUMA_CG001010, isoform A [Clunio marinus]